LTGLKNAMEYSRDSNSNGQEVKPKRQKNNPFRFRRGPLLYIFRRTVLRFHVFDLLYRRRKFSHSFLPTSVFGLRSPDFLTILESDSNIVKMPKLYFYDTGLVCALLGIQNAQQLTYHPLYGSLFETFTISELIKYRYNLAKRNNLFFWRDNIGHEVDILAETPEKLFPIEIKSGRTVTDEFFKGIDYWLGISGEKSGAIIYAGDSSHKRSNNIKIVSWKNLSDLFVD
jgi:hypothetical protein